MVYILSGDKNAYVGQTTGVIDRMNQHSSNQERRLFHTATIIYNEEFNASAITDYEHRLIGLMQSDGRYRLTNGNRGMTRSDYFSKREYAEMFDNLWEELRRSEAPNHIKLADHTIAEIEDSEVFKYSPYKELSDEQKVALQKIFEAIERGIETAEPIVVEGEPGTGKTVLATYLLKILRDDERYRDWNIRIVEPVNSMCATLQDAVGSVHGLSKKDVIRPNDLDKPKYGYVPGKKKCFDILLVDETHRLRKRQSLISYKHYDNVNKALGLPSESTQIDWILDQAKLPIFFYDPMQDVGPGCVDPETVYASLGTAASRPIHLETQMRVKGGAGYLDYIQAILAGRNPKRRSFDSYELEFHDDFAGFYDSFENTLERYELTRMLSGWAWEWKTRPGGKHADEYKYDFEIEGRRLRWNSFTENWVPKGTADPAIAHEIGCIHCIQGYDLNYAYVIIADDLRIDSNTGELVGNKDSYWDQKGKNKTTAEQLTEYIKKIYYVLLTRGIYGTHIYVYNPELRDYLRRFFV